MNENISDDEGGDSIDPFDPNVTDQDDSEEEDEDMEFRIFLLKISQGFVKNSLKPTMTPLRVR